MAPTLITLRYFRAVAMSGNVSRAADTLNVAQSAVSRQVLLLEQELGAPLLLRHRRGVELTPAGEHVLQRANEVLRLVGDLGREVSSMDSTPQGSLRFGYPASLGPMLVAPVIGEIVRGFDAVTVALFEGFSQELTERIEDDRLDAGIVSWLDPNPELLLTPLFSEDISLVGLPDDWSFDGLIKPADIVGLPLLTTRIVGARLARWAEEAEISLGRIIETDSQSTLLPLVMEGMGHLVVPRSAVHHEVEAGRLRVAPLKGLRMTRYLAERKDRVRSSAVALLVERLDQRIAALGTDPRVLTPMLA